MTMKLRQSGFTLVEIAIVLLIVTILLGYTVALFPQQQKLKQYRALDLEMDRVMEAIIGFAQVNGRLPCPALPNGTGNEDYDIVGNTGCNSYGGFVAANTLGLDGRLNEDGLLIDPWGNPYRYYVTDVDFNGGGKSDFTAAGEMRAIGLVDSDSDTYIDLDGRYLICDAASSVNNDCAPANVVFGDYSNYFGTERYRGAPFVLLSMGKNWNEPFPAGERLDEVKNRGATEVTGTSGTKYRVKVVEDDVPPGEIGDTTFVKRTTGFADDFDDVVRWVSPSVLYSRMIQAGQLP
jgi:prepilin-type N-terminal cleavage/methylation domain-containing protein